MFVVLMEDINNIINNQLEWDWRFKVNSSPEFTKYIKSEFDIKKETYKINDFKDLIALRKKINF